MDEDAMDEEVVDKLKKRKLDNADKDEGSSAGSDRGLKRHKTSKDVEPSTGSKSKESKSSSSKGTKSQPKSSGKSTQAEESVFESDWFKKPKRPLTPDPDWNDRKYVDFRPPQTWISKIAQAEKAPLSFDELMSTPIDFSAYVMNNLKIDNLTQDLLVGPDFNLLKGTCKSKEYLFELSKPLPLIMERDLQVVPADFFFNNDLEYLKRGSSSKKYTTSTTKTKAAKYDIPSIEDMVPSLWSPVIVAYDRYVV
ncbi:hypothetical protein Tco_0807204 [Tanacetum coccineum]